MLLFQNAFTSCEGNKLVLSFPCIDLFGCYYMNSDHPIQSLNAGSESQHPVCTSPADKRFGFRKPTSIFFQHFCCAQTICSQRQRNVQIKACYPLLRGRLHIMTKGLAFISICERITHCCAGGSLFFSLLFLLLCISYKICNDRSQLTWPTLKKIRAFAHVGG